MFYLAFPRLTFSRNTYWYIFFIAVPEYEIVPIHHIEKRSLPDDRENLIEEPIIQKKQESPPPKLPDKKHLKLTAFGKPFSLKLVPTEGLFKKGKLKIWTIEPNATAQHGIEYVELPDEVSFKQVNSIGIGIFLG